MKRKPFFNLLLAALLGFALFTGYRHVTVVDPYTLPLHTGDLIFQTRFSLPSYAIRHATNSRMTHVGLIYYHDYRYYVVDAGRWGVRINRFDTWVSSGMGNQFMVLRHEAMKKNTRTELVQEMQTLIGKSYDLGISFDDDAYYSSELPYALYQHIKLPIGKPQLISTLNTEHYSVQALLRSMWRQLPYCKYKSITYEACAALLNAREIITPESLASDANMVQIYSNFKPLQ